jgi:hypothetical protein
MANLTEMKGAAAGLAALSICESLLLALRDRPKARWCSDRAGSRPLDLQRWWTARPQRPVLPSGFFEAPTLAGVVE